MAFKFENLDYELTIKNSQVHFVIDEPLLKVNITAGNKEILLAALKKLIPGDKWDFLADVVTSQIESQGPVPLAGGGKFKTA